MSFVLIENASCETREDIRKLYKTGVDYINDMNFEAAEAVFRKIAESGYEFAEAYNNLGYAKMRLQKYDEAIFEFKAALKLNPDFADALNNLGVIYAKRPATATMGLQLLKKAVELQPNNANFHDSLGTCFHALGFAAEAEVEFKTAMLVDRKLVAPVYNMGVLYESNGKETEAIKYYTTAVSMKKDHLMSNFRLFKMYLKQDDANLSSNYLSNIFKILKNSKLDKFERFTVESEILCNLKTFIVETAINFNVEMKKLTASETSEAAFSPSEYLIAYEEFSNKKLFSFFEGTELRCPETGKYYTNYVNHVTCPIHGSLPLFTDKIFNLKDLRGKYRRNICSENRRILDYAIFINDISDTEEVGTIDVKAINDLIKKRYLRDIPECPDGGKYSLDAAGFVSCSIHTPSGSR
ncbi:MAG TPA: tetratricopeptide repeat protein [Candidatus Wallbacteria bacterium]|nr:tetratricopeptide repeat protein [Candidatus Wallbacteria bacterium]